jgi:hypothetical protein
VRPGDLVVTAPPVAPVGRVDGVLSTSRGVRLVVERASAPGTFVVLDGAGLAPGEPVSGPDAPETEPRWEVTAVRPEELSAGGVFRRVLGRLQAVPPASAGGAGVAGAPPADDAATRESLAALLRADPLLAGSEVQLSVLHGVARLTGWVPTVATKVQAYHLARTAPGVWAATTRLASDEETRLVVRDALRARPDLAEAVGGVEVDLGVVTVVLLPDASPALTAPILELVAGVPGVRAAAARPPA